MIEQHKQPDSKTNRVPIFDAIRGIAILLVVAGHAGITYLDAPESDGYQLFHLVIGNASLGVRLFFVLSGYLITLLLLKERTSTGTISLSSFYIRRSLRIFPAMYLYLAVLAILCTTTSLNISFAQFSSAATYTWNYSVFWVSVDWPGQWFLGHLWTLSLEEQFYLVWPFVFCVTPRKYLQTVCGILILLMPATRIATYFAYPELRGMLGMMFHTAADGILIGCWFALLKDSPLGDRFQHLTQKSFVQWSLIAFVSVISPILYFFWEGRYSVTCGISLDAVSCGLLIYGLHGIASTRHVSARHSTTYLFALLNQSKSLQWLGRLSYSIYLWQQLFLTSFNTTVTSIFPVSLLATIACASISFYLVEMPILKMKKRFTKVGLKS